MNSSPLNIAQNQFNLQIDRSFIDSIIERSQTKKVIEVKELETLILKAKKYDLISESIKNSAENWDSLHPMVQSALLKYKGQPINIIPVF